MDASSRPLADLVAGLAAGGCFCAGHLAGFTRVDPTWAFRDRVLPEQLLYLPVQGACAYRLATADGVLRTGDLLWLPPRTGHSVWLAGPAAGLGLYHFRFRLWHAAVELVPTAPVILPGCGDLRGLCDRWVRDQRRRDAGTDARLGAFVLLMASEVQARLDDGDVPGGLRSEQRRRLEAFVAARPDRLLDSTDLADHLGLGRIHFTRLFKRTYGQPPRTWLVVQRLETARVLLRTTALRVGAVAARLGYASSQLFCRQYAARFGVSPGRDR